MVKNTEIGETSLNKRRRLDVIGDNMGDPFFDSYQAEADTCCAIIDLVGKTETSYVNIIVDKSFLQKIVHSHIIWIKEIEKGLAPKIYVQ